MTHDKPKMEEHTSGDEIPFGSNAVRLTGREWVISAAIVLVVIVFTPTVWKRAEQFEPQPDFRVPYDLSEDYWIYQRHVEQATDDERILVIGDSVVWGEYVDPQHTLSHYLNELDGGNRFANGGLNGAHPLALQGLVTHFAGDVTDTKVVVHCNLLWMSSEERDLQTDKELPFNHPRLVPQFVPRIPSYRPSTLPDKDSRESMDDRMGIVIDRKLPYRKWVHHLRVADFGGQDIPSWTFEHPYDNPLKQIRLEIPPPKNEPHSQPIPWTERGIQPQDIPWIDLDTSLQWQAFRATVELLLDRGNRAFVIVGPFNEHLLTAASRQRYGAMKKRTETWLTDRGIPFHAAAMLPSDEFADASHPLSAGYERLAKQVVDDPAFQRWLKNR